jgi:glycosyltransferase involved in cell wall biosynthesis
MTRPLRIAQVAPVAGPLPPSRSGSIETITSLLTEGLVKRGHQVTLFATGHSRTSASLEAIFERGYREDPAMWPWELCELFNLAAALERAAAFDLIHYQSEYHPFSIAFSRVVSVPLVQTLHHAPEPHEVALWSRHYPDAPFVALSHAQAARMRGLNVVATVHHGLDAGAFTSRAVPDDYVLQAIEIAQRAGIRLVLAAAANDYYRDIVAPLVDGTRVAYAGEVDHAAKVALLGGARALLYPVQTDEPFGLVLAEAAMCGTPVAALDRGAVSELVRDGARAARQPPLGDSSAAFVPSRRDPTHSAGRLRPSRRRVDCLRRAAGMVRARGRTRDPSVRHARRARAPAGRLGARPDRSRRHGNPHGRPQGTTRR